MFSTYTACVCASFYATFHDQVTNYSFWWDFILLNFISRFVTCLLFMFTTFSPSRCHALSVPFSKACGLAMEYTEPPGAHSNWRGAGMLKLTIHLHLQVKVSTSTDMHMDSVTLRLCMFHLLHLFFICLQEMQYISVTVVLLVLLLH